MSDQSITAIPEPFRVTCPYCGFVQTVRPGRIIPKLNIYGHTVFMSAEHTGAGGIEHHCDVLREAIAEARENGSNEAGDTT